MSRGRGRSHSRCRRGCSRNPDQRPAIHREDKMGDGPVFPALQNPRALGWMGLFEKAGQFLHNSKMGKVCFVYDPGDNGWNGKTFLQPLPAVTAAPPAVLVIGLPDGPELVCQALSVVAMTRHAPVPVQAASQLDLGRVLRERRLDQWIVRRSGRNCRLQR